jgi:polyhydroxyalkanoate synthase subunit PhaC
MLFVPPFTSSSFPADFLPTPLSLVDAMRRAAGLGLDAIGLGPVPTRSAIVERTSGMELRAYQDATPTAGVDLLILPAPIKRPYIWDLLPQVSVVRQALHSGFRVWLADWTESGFGDEHGLAHYADTLPGIACKAIEAATGARRVVVAGHSLGGTLAAIFASLHPERVRALALVEAPLAFGEHRGPIGDLLAGIDGRTAASVGLGGPVAGTALSAASASAAPDDFLRDPLLDLFDVLADPVRAAVHFRVLRWTFDEFAMPHRLLEEVVEHLYRGDRYAQDTLTVGGRAAGASRLRAPTAAVVSPAARIVPRSSVLGGLTGLAAERLRVFEVRSERGAMLHHVAALVGPTAHATTWPPLLQWLKSAPE